MIQVFFSNNTQHNFIVEADDMENIEDLLLEYRDDRNGLVFAGSKEQPCLFNNEHVILVVASATKEAEEEVATLCCEGEICR